MRVDRRAAVPPLLAIVYFASGASGLILELVWTRLFAVKVFGGTTLALGTVLAVYMGGLALGSWLGGRVATRLRRPVIAYACCEAGVGLLALLVPWLLTHAYPPVHRWIWQEIAPGPFTFSLIRFGLAAVVLLPPATLLGATLPLMTRQIVRDRASAGSLGASAGWLYSVNTAGAVLGTAAAGFLLLPSLGLSATNRMAALVNLSLAAAVLLARRQFAPFDARPAAPPEKRRPTVPRLVRWTALAAVGVSGAAAMTYQIVWTRAVTMSIGSSVYAFTLILVSFLIGLAGGAALASRLMHRVRSPLRALGLVQLAIGALALANYLYLDELPLLFASLVTGVMGKTGGPGMLHAVMFLIALVAVLPATMVLGASFPLAVRACSEDNAAAGPSVAAVYSVNTIGAILGSFGSAFGLIWMLGMQGAFIAGIVANLIVAAALFWNANARRSFGGPAAALGLAVLALFLPSWGGTRWDPAVMTLGTFRVSQLEDPEAFSLAGVQQLYFKDGASATVSVEGDGGPWRVLKVNGKPDGSAGPESDMPTQVLLAGYPLLLHPAGPSGLDVAVIGWGTGVTVGAALSFPVRHVDAIEIEPNVVEASRFFAPENRLHYPLDRFPYVDEPRLSVILADGRNYLDSTAKTYDLIISEPSNPWISGVSNLFTREHFELAGRRLGARGVFCQWIQTYELREDRIKTLYHTFASAFPHVVALSVGPDAADTVLLGSFAPIPLDLAHVRRALADPTGRAILAQVHFTSPTDVFAPLLFANRQELMRYAGKAPINTDDNALIEFAAPNDLLDGNDPLEAFILDVWPYASLPERIEGMGEGADRADALAALAVSLLKVGRMHSASAMLDLARAEVSTPAVEEAQRFRRLILASVDSPRPLIVALARETRSSELAELLDYAAGALAGGDAEEAGAALEEGAEWSEDPALSLARAALMASADEYDAAECVAILDEVVARAPAFAGAHPEVLYYLSRCVRDSGDPVVSFAWLDLWIRRTAAL